MPVLKLQFKNTVLQEYPLISGQTLTVGRSESNDIVIDSMSVSSLHARIDSVSATFMITDLESTNGTFVNEELISTHTLRDNDVILIGKHQLIFDRSDISSDYSDDIDDEDKTMYLDTAQYRALINKNLGKSSPEKPTPAEQPSASSDNFFIKLFRKFF